jgi:hypothetical protein
VGADDLPSVAKSLKADRKQMPPKPPQEPEAQTAIEPKDVEPKSDIKDSAPKDPEVKDDAAKK